MRQFYILTILLLFNSCSSQKLDIAEIEFQASECFGNCPIFEMKIKKNGDAEYNAMMYNKLTGKFKATIKKSQINNLTNLIEKADFFSLKDNYSTDWTDNPTYSLKITLKNGQVKKIEDYGPSGPENLKLVYDQIFSLRESQNWN